VGQHGLSGHIANGKYMALSGAPLRINPDKTVVVNLNTGV
jgi:hypothetical protein